VHHSVGDKRDVFQIMEEGLSEEKPWFAGTKMGLTDFKMSFAMNMASQRRGVRDGEGRSGRVYRREAYMRALEKGVGIILLTSVRGDEPNDCKLATERYCRKDIPSIEPFKLRDGISNTPFAGKLFSLTFG
jgi:hypothetical protein